MIWYHLYNNGAGIRAGFLCINKDFDAAATAADTLVHEGRVEQSLWVLQREELEALRESIDREIGKLDAQVITVSTNGQWCERCQAYHPKDYPCLLP